MRILSRINSRFSPRVFIPVRFAGTASGAGSNPLMSFPCLDKLESRSQSWESGPEPDYAKVVSGYEKYHSDKSMSLDYGGNLPSFDIAYETWGELDSNKSNAILLHTGLSASSHAKSHDKNTKAGWWEKFIGPGLSIDTNKFFVICTNVLGGCYGSTGPSSIDPADGQRYATRFPILSVNDMVRAQHRLVTEHLGIKQLYASVGSSMGGMQSLAFAREFPQSLARLVSISGCARSHPYSIALRHTQRQVLMADPNWKRGFYYEGIPPHVGMKLAREIATVTYRSGPEWEQRFGRKRADDSKSPALCPDFLIETYLDHQGEKFCLEYDANSLIYISKAMDLFDLGLKMKQKNDSVRSGQSSYDNESCPLPDSPYKEKNRPRQEISTKPIPTDEDLIEGMASIAGVPAFVLGVESDFLFPYWQQREIAEVLKQVNLRAGFVDKVQYHELGSDISLFGHDTFLLDVEHVGGPLKRFLEG